MIFEYEIDKFELLHYQFYYLTYYCKWYSGSSRQFRKIIKQYNKFNCMGAKQTTGIGKDVFDPEEWIQTPLTSYTKNNDPYYSSSFTVISHKTKKNQELEKYDLFFNGPAQFRTYYESFEWRKSLSSVVTARYLKQITKRDICATFYCAAIYVQRIPIRLYQIVDIPIEEGIYVLRSVLQGFSMIFEKTGYFDVSSELICINKEGKVKVWANKNLSKNYPQFSTINHNKDQSQFIQKIIEIVQEAIDFQQNSKFSDFIADRISTVRFENIFGFLTDYIKQERIHSVRQMGSILQLYREKQKGYEHAQSSSNLSSKNTKTKKSVFKVSKAQGQESAFNKTSNSKDEMKLGQLNMNFKNKKHLNIFISDRDPFENRYHRNFNNSKNLTPKKKVDGSFHGKQDKISNYYNNSYSNDICIENNHFPIGNDRVRNIYTPVAFYYKNAGLNSPQNNQRSFQFSKKISYNSNTSRSQQSNQMLIHSHQLKQNNFIGRQGKRQLNQFYNYATNNNKGESFQKNISDFQVQRANQFNLQKLNPIQQDSKESSKFLNNNILKKQDSEQQASKLEKQLVRDRSKTEKIEILSPEKNIRQQKYSAKKQRNQVISPSKRPMKQVRKVEYYSNDQYCEIDPQIAKDLDIYQ